MAYHFDYEISQYRALLSGRSRRKHQSVKRAKGILFFDDTGSGAYYYDLVTRHPIGARVKRLIDILVSLTAITFAAPLFLAIMAAIKLTSPGPIIFRQRRIGFRCNLFDIYKFRTMVVGADKVETADAAFVKPKNDPRVTSVGRILRKYSLDELPQLFNVLEGTMSLVGPRPLRECDLENLPQRSTVRRFATPPGITGLWQVSGRSECVGYRGLQLDRQYVDRWSLALDFHILLQTVDVVLTGKGAA
ncbi:MAG: sugar transferase [Acidobacteria bacterium]|nr:sugar transferase [Acidobacteriota bacterium]MBV9478296.1 sugar transferase [Acidobacteriota bacterium]